MPRDYDDLDAFDSGRSMSESDVEAAESELLNCSDNLKLRLVLLGYYALDDWDDCCRKNPRFFDHLEWLVQHHPRNGALDRICFFEDCHHYLRFTALWDKQVSFCPDDAYVFHNYARFCSVVEPAKSKKLWHDAGELEPNTPRFMMECLLLVIRRGQLWAESPSIEHAEEAFRLAEELSLFLQEFSSTADDLPQNFSATVADLVECAITIGEFDRAVRLAQLFQPPNLLYRSQPKTNTAGKHGWTSLRGRIALCRGDTESAKSCLEQMKDFDVPGMWLLHPMVNLKLADALFAAGEMETVHGFLTSMTKRIEKTFVLLSNGEFSELEADPTLIERIKEGPGARKTVEGYMEAKLEQLHNYIEMIDNTRESAQ